MMVYADTVFTNVSGSALPSNSLHDNSETLGPHVTTAYLAEWACDNMGLKVCMPQHDLTVLSL